MGNFDTAPIAKALCENYTAILKEELVPAMGCTEPIAVAYASAKAREVLGVAPERLKVCCSGNIIKNVKAVTVPNSGGQKGIEAAASLGAAGGDPSRELEVIAGATDEDRARAKELVKNGFCDVSLAEGVPNLYIQVEAEGGGHKALVLIEGRHTNITRIEKDGDVLLDRGGEAPAASQAPQTSRADRTKMALHSILDYANGVDLSDVRETLDRQIQCNTRISQEGLDNNWGARVGKTLLSVWGDDVKVRACAKAAAGSDARMSGCPLPVVINSGSGNQGITVSLPVIEYARSWQLSQEKLYRALLVSNLVSVYIKRYIGPLSAFCGAVSASCGAGAAITYMAGGDYAAVGRTITNTLANVGGIVCDGAKPSCAAKIAASVHAALLAHYMGAEGRCFKGGEGFVEDDVEETIRNMGYIGKVGMKDTDKEILNVMIGKADVSACL